MVVEQETPPFLQWLPVAGLHWLIVVLSVAAAALVIGWIVAAVRHGPATALRMVGRTLWMATIDCSRMSPRRVAALAWLAVKESLRRRVVVVFAVFILLLLFAGWYLHPDSPHPARLYISFVLNATAYLVLIMALLLSALSLPTDIRNRTLHTVVTKPVRASEIVVGRMLGFTLVGTVLLAVMGVISYAFVVRGLAHTHKISPDELRKLTSAWEAALREGDAINVPEIETEPAQGHRHKLRANAVVEEDGRRKLRRRARARTEPARGHWHEFRYEFPERDAGETRRQGPRLDYTIGPPEGRLVARVPVYGKLRFRDRSGNPAERGVNVGDEWAYRSFIQGGTLAAAVWTFDGVTPDRFPPSRFPDGIPLELNLEVFRTYKGDTSGRDIPPIHASLVLRNPETDERVEVRIFPVKEYATDTQHLPYTITRASDGRQLDLFEDLASGGRLEVWIQAIEPNQYLGMAQADAYLLARNAWFPWNFAKAYLGVWLQMVLVVAFGVLFSTLLSGPVAILATVGVLVGGIHKTFMLRLATGQQEGGGPLEAFYRLITQMNLVSEMPEGLLTDTIKLIDVALLGWLRLMAEALPQFGSFDLSRYAAYGFNIPPDLLAMRILTAVGFVLPLLVAGYLCLRMREVAR